MQVSQGHSNIPTSFQHYLTFIVLDVNEHDFVVWVNSGAILCIYWSFALMFLILDITGIGKKYKVQPGKNEPVELKQILKVIDV